MNAKNFVESLTLQFLYTIGFGPFIVWALSGFNTTLMKNLGFFWGKGGIRNSNMIFRIQTAQWVFTVAIYAIALVSCY